MGRQSAPSACAAGGRAGATALRWHAGHRDGGMSAPGAPSVLGGMGRGYTQSGQVPLSAGWDGQRVHAEHAAAAHGRGTSVPDPVSGRERHMLPREGEGMSRHDRAPQTHRSAGLVDEGGKRLEGGQEGQAGFPAMSTRTGQQGLKPSPYNCTIPPKEEHINQLFVGS